MGIYFISFNKQIERENCRGERKRGGLEKFLLFFKEIKEIVKKKKKKRVTFDGSMIKNPIDR